MAFRVINIRNRKKVLFQYSSSIRGYIELQLCQKQMFLGSIKFLPLLLSHVCVCFLSCLTLCDLLDCKPIRLQDFLGKNPGVGCHFLFQGIFPTRDRTYVSCILCIGRKILYDQCHLGSTNTYTNTHLNVMHLNASVNSAFTGYILQQSIKH